MVVTRRQSAGPMPAVASRTNSSTGSSRSKGKAVDKSSPLKDAVPGPSKVPLNGTLPRPPPVGPQLLDDIQFDDDVSSTPAKLTPFKPATPTPPKLKSKAKAKKAPKPKKHRPPKGISIFDIIARVFLVWFTVYTLSVCPDDVQLKSPVCRALTKYRRVILEPYVYPPIRAALDHPAVAPHIQRVQPYYDRAVQISTPLVRRGKREWRNTVVPRVHWLQLRARPYVRRAERQYDTVVAPYVRHIHVAAAQYRLQAEPYVLAAALKTHDAWQTAKPFVLPVWHEAKRVPALVVVYVVQPLGDARRQWVDPQVTKIWDAVVEQGKADTLNVKTASRTKASSAASESSLRYNHPIWASTVDVDLPEPSSKASSVSSLPVPDPTDEAALSASSIVSASASASTPITSSVPANDGPDPSPEAILLSAPPLPEPTDEAAVSASSIIRESISAPDASPSVSPSEPALIPSDVSAGSSSPAQPPPPLDEESIKELDAFLSELEADTAEPPVEPPKSSVHEETEEERAERLRIKAIETAEKRADIEGRHDLWEIEVEHFGQAQTEVVTATLKTLRDSAAEVARSPGGAVRIHVEDLTQEAEKSLKSLKVYAKRLTGDDKSANEKIKTWENVANKVDKKFGDRVDAAAAKVREWWGAHIMKENQEVETIAAKVRTLADQAQADIGMDYSWLADVTYDDWQRYHKLVDNSKEFRQLYLAMQNGTHPDAPANPVADIIEALQEEVDDLIIGFDAGLSRITTSALESFSETKGGDSSTKSDSGSEPEISILPIDPIDPKEKDLGGVPPVILSRGAEEVKAAASRAEEARTAAHGEL